MRIDLIIESDKSAADFTRLGHLAEDYGLGCVWVPNNANGRDPFVNFTPFALESSRIAMGPMAISPFELHPLKMGLALLSLNEIAKGRAAIVVGGGGGVAENIGQRPKQVIQPMRECIEILNMMAAGEAGRYEGDYFPVSWLDTRWVTQPPPMIYAGANGPKLVASAAEYAAGIMASDFVPERLHWLHQIIDPLLEKRGINPVEYPVNNFWAWHVKEDPAEAQREARMWLCVRGTLYDDYIHDVCDPDEAQIVTDHLGSFTRAYYKKSPEIEGVPDEIVDKIVAHGTSASSLDNIDAEVERFRSFERAGLNQISLKVYGNPETAIKNIGEHIVPALSSG
ncbi:MAG: LLM class flavin-dependent oxidoreductase [Gammaproteobacteria bacterium]|nr:LLM class flavin-dependent oxidoreductase [Gammaproteobacteria bacterium]